MLNVMKSTEFIVCCCEYHKHGLNFISFSFYTPTQYNFHEHYSYKYVFRYKNSNIIYLIIISSTRKLIVFSCIEWYMVNIKSCQIYILSFL